MTFRVCHVNKRGDARVVKTAHGYRLQEKIPEAWKGWSTVANYRPRTLQAAVRQANRPIGVRFS